MQPPVVTMPTPSVMARLASRIIREVKYAAGVESYLKTEDRRILEQVIFPYFLNDASYHNILFVGCHWYTRGYNKLFEESKDYWTIDVEPKRARYGAKKHIIDGLQNLREHFAPEALRLILCNGVFGWGLDRKEDVEQAFEACFECLSDDRGVLVVGWDDINERRPFPLEHCYSLRSFKPFIFPPLKVEQYVTDTAYRHTFSFFIKE